MKENQDVTIPCEVSGFPEPTVHWYFNGLSMMEKLIGKLYSCLKYFNDEYLNNDNFTAEETKYKKLEDGLFIRNANRTDSGEYTCKAFQISEIMTNVEEQTVRLNVHCELILSP